MVLERLQKLSVSVLRVTMMQHSGSEAYFQNIDLTSNPVEYIMYTTVYRPVFSNGHPSREVLKYE